MSKIKQFLMEQLESTTTHYDPKTKWFVPNMDDPDIALAFAEAEFERSLAAFRNALSAVDASMPARLEATEQIVTALKSVESWVL